jgi:hypothetical protein
LRAIRASQVEARLLALGEALAAWITANRLLREPQSADSGSAHYGFALATHQGSGLASGTR